MSKLSNNQRKKRQVPSIDLDELYNASNNRGMCSFLERPPEEARLRRELRSAVDKAELAAQAGLSVPFPVDEPEAVAIPQGHPGRDTSTLTGARDMRQADILPQADAESRPRTTESDLQSEITIKLEKARPELEPASAILARLAKTGGISHWDDRSPVDAILPVAGSLPDGAEYADSTGISTTASVVTTPDVMTGVDITGGKTTGVEQITTPVATTPVLSTPDIATPDESGLRSRPQSVTQILPQKRQEAITTPVEATPDIKAPVITTAIRTASPPEQPTPVRTTPDITTPVISQARPYNLHRAVLVQDGHSHTEQLLYDILWRSAKSAGQGDVYRFVQIPQSELAAAVRMTTKNLRIALDRLVEKLAIEELQSFDRGTRIARTWKVYSYKSILERRKAAGMEWVIRDRGVRFIDPGSIPVKPTRVVMPEALITTGVKSTESTPVGSPQTTAVKTTPPLIGQVSSPKDRTMSTAPAPPLVAAAIIDVFGFVDDDALKILVRKCRNNAPDATDQEIAELGAMTARRLARMRNVDNHIGLLITQTAKCFLGEPFAIYRREKHENERRYAAMMEEEQGREDH